MLLVCAARDALKDALESVLGGGGKTRCEGVSVAEGLGISCSI